MFSSTPQSVEPATSRASGRSASSSSACARVCGRTKSPSALRTWVGGAAGAGRLERGSSGSAPSGSPRAYAASRIGRYPVHRHRLPLSACRSNPFGPCSWSGACPGAVGSASAPDAVPSRPAESRPAGSSPLAPRPLATGVQSRDPLRSGRSRRRTVAAVVLCRHGADETRRAVAALGPAAYSHLLLHRMQRARPAQTLGGDDLLAVERGGRSQTGVDRRPSAARRRHGRAHQDGAGAALALPRSPPCIRSSRPPQPVQQRDVAADLAECARTPIDHQLRLHQGSLSVGQLRRLRRRGCPRR